MRTVWAVTQGLALGPKDTTLKVYLLPYCRSHWCGVLRAAVPALTAAMDCHCL